MRQIPLLVLILLTLTSFSQNDEMRFNSLKNLKNNPDSLLKMLVAEAGSPKLKAIFIHDFVKYAYKLDVKEALSPKEVERVDLILKKKVLSPYEINIVFAHLCSVCGIPSTVLTGYSKDIFFKQGQIFTLTNHYWTLIKPDNEWLVVDVVRNYGTIQIHSCFLTGKQRIKVRKSIGTLTSLISSDKAIYMNMPECPYWQVVPCEIPIQAFESGDSAITAEMNRMGSIPCYNLKDSVQKELLLSNNERQMMRAIHAGVFNKRNQLPLAVLLKKRVEEALPARDSLSKMKFIEELATSISLMKEQKLYLAEAQKHMIYSLVLHDSIVNSSVKKLTKLSNRSIAKNNALHERNTKSARSLKQENTVLKTLNAKLEKESMNDIHKTKKKNTEEEKALIQQFIVQIKQNRKLIEQNKSYIADVSQENSLTFESFITKDYSEILRVHQANLTKLKALYNERKLNRFVNDIFLYNQLDSLYKRQEFILLGKKKTGAEQLDLVDFNNHIIDSVYRENKRLTKENKRLLKKTYKLSVADNNETTLFLNENKSLFEDNISIVKNNEAKITFNKASNSFMKKESQQLKKGNAILTKLQRMDIKSSTIIRKFKSAETQRKLSFVDVQLKQCELIKSHLK